ncbi:MAG: energy transducer TonB [Gammaproteobacteria bacterium]
MTDRPRPLPAFLPWLFASVAAHAVLLAHWPQSGASTAVADGAEAAQTLQLQLIRYAEPAPGAVEQPAPLAAPVHAYKPAPAPAPQSAQAAVTVERHASRSRTPATPERGGPAAVAATRDADAPADAATTAPAVAAAAADSGAGRTGAAAGWPELAALLHAAIDRHKRYPQSALSMGREGSARVDFRLRPDGNIDDVNIGVSSGVRALDLAAYRAVRAIAPFADAGRYLDSTQRFQVDVVFRIN